MNPDTNKISGCDRGTRDHHSSTQHEVEAIRLLNGGRGNGAAGIVEVKIDNVWGGICDDGFTISEAHVVCRQLGFLGGATLGFLTGFLGGAGSGSSYQR